MKNDILDFLKRLVETQNKMLAVLQKKQKVLVQPEKNLLSAVTAEEKEAAEEMQQILQRREELLTSARLQNIAGNSIERLCEHFFSRNFEVQRLLDETKHRTQQIRFLAYTNWTMTRKSMVHIAQILEMLETRGEGKATYNPQPNTGTSRSGFVDRVA
jgi:hypothetical protein